MGRKASKKHKSKWGRRPQRDSVGLIEGMCRELKEDTERGKQLKTIWLCQTLLLPQWSYAVQTAVSGVVFSHRHFFKWKCWILQHQRQYNWNDSSIKWPTAQNHCSSHYGCHNMPYFAIRRCNSTGIFSFFFTAFWDFLWHQHLTEKITDISGDNESVLVWLLCSIITHIVSLFPILYKSAVFDDTLFF